MDDEELPVALGRLMAVTEASFEQRAQLERALKTRIVVEQAKGVLTERFRVRPDAAYELLRGTARFRQMSVHDLARAVVETSDTPAAILAYIQKSMTEDADIPSVEGRREGS
ncbi:MAG: ANTAR domain-containing protein [Actinobacteria bacterium]|nr:ANTAR domain-containing protein [Actinomycetota bacterium]